MCLSSLLNRNHHLLNLPSVVASRPTHESAFIQVVGELNGNWKNEWLLTCPQLLATRTALIQESLPYKFKSFYGLPKYCNQRGPRAKGA